jgi:hypothetical protein
MQSVLILLCQLCLLAWLFVSLYLLAVLVVCTFRHNFESETVSNSIQTYFLDAHVDQDFRVMVVCIGESS